MVKYLLLTISFLLINLLSSAQGFNPFDLQDSSIVRIDSSAVVDTLDAVFIENQEEPNVVLVSPNTVDNSSIKTLP